MKAIKYLMIGVLTLSLNTPVVAQDEHKAVIDQATNIIKAKGNDVEKQIKDIYKANKKNADVLVAIGRAYLDVKDTINASKYAELAIKANKNYGNAYVLAGDIEVAKEDGGSASAWYEQATLFDPKNPEGYRRYAQVNSKVSPTAAVAKLEELRQQRPDYPVDIISAEIYDRAGNLKKALEYYKKVDKAKMEDYQLVNYALNLFLQGQFENSLEISQFGNQKFPRNPALNRISFFNLTNLKRFPEALQYADALFNKSDDTKITASDYLYYGHAYLGNKDYDNAIAMFTKSLENNTDNSEDKSDALKQIAEAYSQKADYANAASKYEEYLKSKKEITASDFAGLATIYLTQAEEAKEENAKKEAYKKAEQIYVELGEKFPSANDYAILWQARINSYLDPNMETYAAKPFYEALANMLEAKANRDTNDNNRLLEAYQYLGFYYFKTDKKPEYTNYWNKVLQIDPENATAKQILSIKNTTR